MKHFLILIILILPCLAFAQPVKHMFAVGGGISYAHDKSPQMSGVDISTNRFSSSLKVGYFFIDRLCTGVYFPYSRSKSTYSDTEYSKSRNIGYGPFVKYYQPLKGDFYALAHVGYYWGRTTYHSHLGDFDYSLYNVKGNSSEFGLGLSYLASNHVAVELIGSLSKSYQNNVSWRNDSYGDHFSLSLGLQVFIGKKAD